VAESGLESPVVSRHLDLGCGQSPRDPYSTGQPYGVDLMPTHPVLGDRYRQANLAVEPIPFPDSHFSSVSAFDFLEHVPRILAAGSGTRLPFIELMNEIHRVLEPGGRFYALTPAYPHPSVFVDPTHVNILTEHSHTYFCGTRPEAWQYGFNGHFALIQSRWVVHSFRQNARELTMAERFTEWRRHRRGRLSHLLWEFFAKKT
jgi:SAM-dependent methyltransferase